MPLPVVWSPDYEMDLGRHVFPTEKYRLVHARLLEDGVIRERHVSRPEPIAWEHLRLVHTEAYLEKLRGGSFTQAEVWRMELPFAPAVREAFRTCCGGTTLAGELALDRSVSIHLGGGFHHAFPDHGEGFCLLNDVAVAVRTLRSEGRLQRAAVVDCDVHHGNGTAAIFQSDPRTYTLSLHQSDLYPARKPRGDLDVGMPAGTGDRRYLRALDDALEEMFGAIDPDLILYLAGADPYRRDQLGGLELTREGLARRDRAVLERAREADTPVVILLAGGYAHRLEDTVEIHARTARIAHQVLDELPEPNQEEWMVRLHDIMTVDPLTIDPQATLREAAELLAAEHVSGLPVVSGSELVGVISATDLMHFDADRPTPARGQEEAGDSDWTLGEDMGLESRGLEPTADEDEPGAAYFTEMRSEGATDLYERFGLSREGSGGRHDLEDVRVGEIMTREVLTLPPETEASEAARRMLRADVHRVLVVEGEKLLGVVSTTDMMKAVAQHGLAG